MKILISEDDLTSRHMLEAVLRKQGHEVETTVNGTDAWTILQRPDAPRLVILDWMMPEMDGVEVTRRVRELPTERPPYIIMLTARGEKADIIAGLNAGANDYLPKPFDPGELNARVGVGQRMVEMQDALLESRKALAHQAAHDSLTGLLNRGAILERLERELARAERHGESVAIGVCDIDHFKRINDTHGHQTGDDVLREVSRLLRENVRQYDAVGRIGGEEFLIVAPMKPGSGDASPFERLRAEISGGNIQTRSGALSITVSVGVARSSPGSDMDALLGAADAALYEAKALGRDRVVYADGVPM